MFKFKLFGKGGKASKEASKVKPRRKTRSFKPRPFKKQKSVKREIRKTKTAKKSVIRMKELEKIVEEKRNICERCHKPIEIQYYCAECGKKFCFDHVEDVGNKLYCAECLKKIK